MRGYCDSHIVHINEGAIFIKYDCLGCGVAQRSNRVEHIYDSDGK